MLELLDHLSWEAAGHGLPSLAHALPSLAHGLPCFLAAHAPTPRARRTGLPFACNAAKRYTSEAQQLRAGLTPGTR